MLGKLVRALGSQNIDFRVRQSDFGADAVRPGAPWLGMPVAELAGLDRLLLVGSFLRQDHPLLAARVRKAVAGGCRVSVLHAADDPLLMRVAGRAICAPSTWLGMLAQIGVAVARAKSLPLPPAEEQYVNEERQQKKKAKFSVRRGLRRLTKALRLSNT